MLGSLLLAAALSTPAAQSAPPLNPAFRHYGVLDGLPSDAAYTVEQDHSGYVWIGTRDGLARFDANEFRIFRHDATDANSLASNDVSAVLVDAQGRVWAGGEDSGLNLFRPQRDDFTHWRHDSRDPRSLSGNDVIAIAQTSDGAIWVGVYAGGLNRLLADGRSFSHVRHRKGDPDGLLSDTVTALAAAADGGLWIGTDAGLQLRNAHGHLTRIALPGTTGAVTVWQLNADGRGVEAATDAGVFRIDEQGDATRLSDAAAYATLRDARGDLWIAQQGQLELLRGGEARHYRPAPRMHGSLPGALPVGLMADREGGIWITLLDGGVAYLPPAWDAFDGWNHVPGDANSLAEKQVRALAASANGSLWAGGSNGALDKLQPRDGSVIHYAGVLGLPQSSIASLLEDRAGRLWVGHQHGLRVLEKGRTRDAHLGAGDAGRRIYCLMEAHDGVIYFTAVGAGAARIDPQTLRVTALKPPMRGTAAQQVHQLQEGPDGAIWSASLAGLARLAPGSDAFRFVPGVARGAVDAFAFAHDGSLWLARGDRLEHYAVTSRRARLSETVTAARGWPTVDVGGLQADADERVWATTPRGLVLYDPARREVRTFTAADGLSNPEFFPHASLRGADGALYSGTLDGVVRVRTSALKAARVAPQIVLAYLSVRRNGHPLRLDPAQPVALRWNDSELTATARALSFADPQRNHYRFRLRGFDPDWVDTGTRDTREFSSLPAGDYRLQVSAANGDGAWSAASAPVLLHIAAPLWATPWAWAAYALTTVLVLALIVWTMRRRLEQRHRFALVVQRQQLAEQANTAKTHFLAGMAHEIRTPMTGVLGMTELLLQTPLDERQRGFADGIRRCSALLLRQVDDALDLARIEAGKLHLHAAPFDPAALLRDVAALEQGLAKQKGLCLRIEIDDHAPRHVLGDELRVKQIVLNLTHNALKFTQTGSVRLRLARESNGVIFSVIDSGPGMSNEECARVFERFEQTEHGRRARGTGLGLSICRELATLMHGRIDVQSESGAGCAFHAHLPLQECAEDAAASADVSATPIDDSHSAAPPSSLRLLLVEDDADVAEVLCGLLHAQGHHVTHATNALAALAEVDTAARPFGAILSDLELPGMHGISLAKLLRARGYAQPIVAVTAASHGDEEQRAIDAGMNALLRKPVLPERLREVLEKVLDGETCDGNLHDRHSGRHAVADQESAFTP